MLELCLIISHRAKIPVACVAWLDHPRSLKRIRFVFLSAKSFNASWEKNDFPKLSVDPLGFDMWVFLY